MYSLEKGIDEEKIVTRPRYWPVLAFVSGCWWCLWVALTVEFVNYAWLYRPPLYGLAICMVILVPLLSLVTLLFLWQAFGQKIVTISESGLGIELRIGNRRLGKGRFFPAGTIARMRFEMERRYVRGREIRSCVLKFDCAGRTEQLYDHLRREEYEELLQGPLRRFT